jgi:hypothetical protein
MSKPRPALFKWRHFEPEIIVCAVRWYLRLVKCMQAAIPFAVNDRVADFFGSPDDFEKPPIVNTPPPPPPI